MRRLALLALAAALSGCVATVAVGPGGTPTAAQAGPTISTGAGAAVNRVRTSAGVPALRESRVLAEVARAHAEAMAATGRFSHIGADGRRPYQRVNAAGYCFRATAENIAYGAPHVEDALSQWMGSTSHRISLLGRTFRDFGIANVADYWVLVLARPCVPAP